jgi:predicted ferric reductase
MSRFLNLISTQQIALSKPRKSSIAITGKSSSTMKKKTIHIILYTIGGILALALISDVTSEEMQWSAADYLIAAVILLAAAASIVFIKRKITGRRARLTAFVILAILFVLVWGELAVGLFGTPWAGN